MLALATWQSRLLQNGRQRRYVFVVFATLTVGVAGTLIVKDGIVLPDAVPVLAWYKWLIAAILVAATLVTVIARSRLTRDRRAGRDRHRNRADLRDLRGRRTSR